MSCKGICEKYKSKNSWRHPKNPSKAYCTACELSTNWEGLFCPCCGYKLRRKTRQSEKKVTKKYVR